MPLSTSSSNQRIPPAPYVKLWLLTIATALSLICAAEYIFRHQGHLKSFTDNTARWCREMDKAESGRAGIVLIGASQGQLGIQANILENCLGLKVANLTVNGNSPLPILRHISDGTEYQGLIICDLRESHAATEYNTATINGFLEHYLGIYSLGGRFDKLLNLYLVDCLQRRFVFFTSNISLRSLLKFEEPFYLKSLRNRSKLAFYRSMVPDDKLSKANAIQEQKMYAEEESRHWNNNLIRIRSWVDRIRARGGKVLFIRMPGDGDFAEDRYPREVFWNKLKDAGLTALYCKDVPALSRFESPDNCHLDAEDASVFTMRLCEWLKNAQIL